MNLTTSGSIHSISGTEQKTSTFSVRTFVLEIKEEANGNEYVNHVQFQLVNTQCAMLDNFKVGQAVTVHFNLRGNLWTDKQGVEKAITNLSAWKIEAAAPTPSEPKQHSVWDSNATTTETPF